MDNVIAKAGDAELNVLPDLVNARMAVIGAGGVGLAAARLARSLGVSIALADCSAERLKETHSVLPGAATYNCDARDEASVSQFLDAAGADHILLATGSPLFGHVGSLSTARLMDWVGDRIEPIMAIANWIARQERRPRSFTIVSGWIWLPQPDLLSWSLMGPAIKGMVEHLAVELGPTRVNAVGPGPMVDSGMYLDATAGLDRQAKIAELDAQLPIGRAILLQDTARQILYAAGDPAATGGLRHVDGGMTLTMRPMFPAAPPALAS